MKEVVPEAYKNLISCFVFTSRETVEFIKAYLEEQEARLGKFEDG